MKVGTLVPQRGTDRMDILDWIFEGIVNWVASIVSQLFDAVSGLFLEALGTDMTRYLFKK